MWERAQRYPEMCSYTASWGLAPQQGELWLLPRNGVNAILLDQCSLIPVLTGMHASMLCMAEVGDEGYGGGAALCHPEDALPKSACELSISCSWQVLLCVLPCIRKIEKMTSSSSFNHNLSPDFFFYFSPSAHYSVFSSLPGVKYRPLLFPLTDLFFVFANPPQQRCVRLFWFPEVSQNITLTSRKALNSSLVALI